jgi:hypothetical protein
LHDSLTYRIILENFPADVKSNFENLAILILTTDEHGRKWAKMEKHGLIPKNLIDQQQNKSKYPSVKFRVSSWQKIKMMFLGTG